MKRVAVIGAGPAGLSAASLLQSSGRFNVQIFESRGRIGGRVFSDPSIGNVDIGASWIHGKVGNPIFEIAEKHGMELIYTEDNECIYYADGSRVPDEVNEKVYELFHEKLQDIKHNPDKYQNSSTLRELEKALTSTELGNTLDANEKKLWRWLVKLQHVIDGGDLAVNSFAEYTDLAGGHYLIKGGYSQIINILAKDLQNIKLHSKVKRIKYGDEGVNIQVENTETKHMWEEDFDYAVVTLPLGVLKTNTVEFSPKLPKEKLEAIDTLKCGVVEKVIMIFEKPFWPDVPFVSYINEDDQPDKMFNFTNASKVFGKPVLISWACGEFAKFLASQPKEAVLEMHVQVLQKMFGEKAEPPKQFHMTSWHKDENSLDSYSFVPVQGTGAQFDQLRKSVSNRLFFAGEATHRNFFGTVHGAYLTGRQAAREILDLN